MDLKIIFIIAAFVVVAAYCIYDNNKKTRLRQLEKIKKSYGKKSKRKITEDELSVIAHYYEDAMEASDTAIDDITWNDLNMNDVYRNMNICNSSVGQEYLYKMLRIPSGDEKVLKEIDRLSDFFDRDEKSRLEIQKVFANLGFARHISLADYLGLIVELKAGSNIVHYIAMSALVISFVICLFFNPVVGIGLVIASVAFSIITYYSFKAKVEAYFICISQLVKMLAAAKAFAGLNISELSEYNRELKEIYNRFSNITKNAGLIVSGNVNGSLGEMVLEYVRMLTHIDLIKFNNMVRLIGDKESDMYRLFENLGFVESCICVASYRRTLQYYSKPDFINKKLSMGNAESIVLKDAYHPLIDKPVANSIETRKHILLTGSNASGKSTFLKTVAINALLSQSIYTSVSKEYKAPVFRIYSSMSLRDDLGNHDSYYIVEIKALKRIIDAVNSKADTPVLCFVDEVLRGTNTVERIAASSEILKSMKYKNVLVFAATHDIELTSILEKYYDNYHFEEQVTDNDVKFNFRLFKGPATTRNAIKLLNIIGYDKEIIENAEMQAKYFLDTGSWKM